MKTLKKTLCLVLAVVMAVGVLILPANAATTFTDTDKISSTYKDAVNTLINYGILQGKLNDGKYAIDPQGNVTRAEVAALTYRMLTGDISSDYVSNYTNYANVFTDVTADWMRGPVGFCANGKLVVGIGGNKYNPLGNVTGYELLAVMLRALGYGQLDEFTGAKWKENTYAQAVKSGLDKNITKDDLSKALTREKVAQIMYNTILAARVVYTPGYGYTYVHDNPLDTETSINGKLIDDGADVEPEYDDFGSPKATVVKHSFTFNWPVTNITKYYDKAMKTAQYFAAVSECDISTKLGLSANTVFETYTNGKAHTSKTTIEPIDEVNMIGAQGRETLAYVYKVGTKDYNKLVYKDTVLAVVTASNDALYDTAGHLVKAAGSTVTVFANKMMEGYNSPNSGNNKVYTFSTTVSQKFDVGTVLSAHIITDVNNTLSIKCTLKDVAVAKAVTVTVSGIKSNSSRRSTGFVGTDGNTYLYAVSYSYNANKGATVVGNPATTLGTADIGKTYTVYVTEGMDGSNYNVIGIAPQSGTPNYGVVTNVTKVSIGTDENGDTLYAQQLTVLKQDKSTETILYVGNHATGNKTGNFELSDLKGKLITYDTNPQNIKYKSVAIAEPTGYRKSDGVKPGKADTLLASDAKVNDGTVFFIETYAMSNSKSGYVTTGYEVYNGFKTIPALRDGMDVYDSDNDKKIYHAGMVITYFAGADDYADYVLIRFGTESSTPPTSKTAHKYVYIDYERQQHTIYDDNYTFNAVVDGTTTSFVISSAYALYVAEKGNGLYIYEDMTNGNHGRIAGPVNYINGATNAWSNHEGVIQLTDGIDLDNHEDWSQYLTVVDNAPIHIINPKTGVVTDTIYDLNVISDPDMYANAKMWVELNEYGWVDRIYVINNMKDDDAHTKPSVDPYTYKIDLTFKNTMKTGLKFYLNGTDVTTTKSNIATGDVELTGLTTSDAVLISGLIPNAHYKLTTKEGVIIYLDPNANGFAKVDLAAAAKAYAATKTGLAFGSEVKVTLTVEKIIGAAKIIVQNEDEECITSWYVPHDTANNDTTIGSKTLDDTVELVSVIDNYGVNWLDYNDTYAKLKDDHKTIVLTPTARTWGYYTEVTVTVKDYTKPTDMFDVRIIDSLGSTIGEELGKITYLEGKASLYPNYEAREIVRLNGQNQNKVITGVTGVTVGNWTASADSDWVTKVFKVTKDGKGLEYCGSSNGIDGDLVITVTTADVAGNDVYQKTTEGSGTKTAQTVSPTDKAPNPQGWTNGGSLYSRLGIEVASVSGNTINVTISRDKFEHAEELDYFKLLNGQGDATAVGTFTRGAAGYVGLTFIGTSKTDTLKNIKIDDVYVGEGANNPENIYFAIATAERKDTNCIMILNDSPMQYKVSYIADSGTSQTYMEWIVNITVVA